MDMENIDLQLCSSLDCCWPEVVDLSADYQSVNFQHRNRGQDCFLANVENSEANLVLCWAYALALVQQPAPKK